MTTNPGDTDTAPLYTAAQTRELDRVAIEEAGIPGYTLMTRAGEACWELVHKHWPDLRHIVVLCGTGNNGGDGYVVARLAREAGVHVQVLQLGDPGAIRGDARTALDAYLEDGGETAPFEADALTRATVIVDALLGTGLERPLEGDWHAAVTAVNRTQLPVVAVDIPSGLHADHGTVLGAAIRAEHTITFIGRKQGLYTGQGSEYAGKVSFAGLAVPETVYQQVESSGRLLTEAPLGALAERRSRAAHKGHFGHVLVIGGGTGMTGAVRLAGEAALRSGAGLVSLATRPEHAAALAAACPELMSHGVSEPAELQPLLQRATVIAAGPGLGRSEWARSLLSTALEAPQPLVLDADALNLLAGEPTRREDWVLTPHPGEAGRLLRQGADTIEADRCAAVHAITERYGGTTVLKGAGTLIHNEADGLSLCAAGNPGMASGGMGDVLSGIIAALIAQGLPPSQAAVAGVCVHAGAADRAAGQGERGMTARDVIAEVRAVLNPDGTDG